MKSTDAVGITFANAVVGRGILNEVVNVNLAALNFTPTDDGKAIDPDPVIVARLRMDVPCAKQLHEALGQLLEIIDQAKSAAATGAAPPPAEITTDAPAPDAKAMN